MSFQNCVRWAILCLAIATPWTGFASDWPEFRGPTAQGLIAGSQLPLHWSASTNVAWKQSIPGSGWSSPVLKGSFIYLTSGFDRPILLAIRPDGQGDVTDTHIAWQLTKSAPNTPSPLVVDNEVYIVSDGGIASCVDAKTGKVHWQERVGGNYSASPVHAAGRIYFQNEEGTCVVVKAGRNFEKIAENPLGERSLASFAASASAFYIRTAESLFKIGR